MAADGSVIIQADVDAKKAQAELNRLQKRIDKLKAEISANEAKRSPLVDQAEELRAQIKEATAEAEKYKQQWLSGAAGADRDEMAARDRVAELRAEYNELLPKIEEYDEKIRLANEELDSGTTKAGQLSAEISGVGDAGGETAEQISEIGDASQETAEQVSGIGDAGQEAAAKADSAFAKFEKRILGLAKRVFVFSLFTKALRSLRSYLAETVKENEAAAAAIDNLKNAFAGLVQPLVNAVIPALILFMDILSNVLNTISSLFGGLKGVSSGLSKEEKNLKGVGGAAKGASKSLAAFDEINQLSDSSGGGGGGGIEAEGGADYTSVVEPGLAAVAGLLTGIFLVALGTILLFSGHIPIGIAMILAGGLMIWGEASENWGLIEQKLQGPLGRIIAIISGALLIIGAILLFSGASIPIGLGLMVAGAAGLATVIAANWDAIPQALQGPIGAVVAIVSGALLAIGVVLLFSGAAIPLGIGLIAAGAAGLATTAAINWDWLPNKLKEIWADIKNGVKEAWNAIISFLAGAWEKIKTGAVTAWNAVSGAFSSAATWFYNKVVAPIGNFFSNLWTNLKQGAVDIWEGIMQVFGTVGTFFELTFSRAWRGIVSIFSVAGDIFNDIKDGVVTAFKAIVNALIKGINKVVAIPFNAINAILQSIHDVNVLGVKPFTWVGTIAVPEIPLLAQGAVIPPNKEFLAVLGDQKSGTNIETPLSTMIQAFKTAMAEMNTSNEAVMVVDGEVFGRLVYKLGGRETKRVGISLTGV